MNDGAGLAANAVRLHPRQPPPGDALHRRHLESRPAHLSASQRHDAGLRDPLRLQSAAAIAREKQIKGGSRAKKIALIETMNPEWKDLYESLA